MTWKRVAAVFRSMVCEIMRGKWRGVLYYLKLRASGFSYKHLMGVQQYDSGHGESIIKVITVGFHGLGFHLLI